MAWVDFKKAYDMFGISENLVTVMPSSMSHWEVKRFSNDQFLVICFGLDPYNYGTTESKIYATELGEMHQPLTIYSLWTT